MKYTRILFLCFTMFLVDYATLTAQSSESSTQGEQTLEALAEESDNAKEQNANIDTAETNTEHETETAATESPYPPQARLNGRHIAVAISETLLSNIFLTTFNRIVLEKPYAIINLDTIKTNIINPWVWDNDEFNINQAGHPLQGSFYFVAGRSNGFNFWQSLLLTTFGSVTWEIFAENETPSYNDLIITPTGGAVFGEILHRLYLNANKKLPALAWILSPQDALTYLITGERAPDVHGGIEQLEFYLPLGFSTTNLFFEKNTPNKNDTYIPNIGLGVNVIYGDAFGHDTQEPLDSFTFTIEMNGAQNNFYMAILFDGLLFSRALWDWQDFHTTLGISLHYDYIYENVINYSNNAIGITFSQRFQFGNGWKFQYTGHLNWSYLCGIDYYWLLVNDAREDENGEEQRLYDLDMGGTFKTSLQLSHRVFGTLSLKAQAGIFHTIPRTIPSQGSSSTSAVQLCELSYEHMLNSHLALGISDIFYHKTALYHQKEDLEQFTNYVRLFAKYKW